MVIVSFFSLVILFLIWQTKDNVPKVISFEYCLFGFQANDNLLDYSKVYIFIKNYQNSSLSLQWQLQSK